MTRPEPGRTGLRRAGAAGAAAVLALTGCGPGSVEVDAATPPADARPLCDALLDTVPGRVAGAEPRIIEPPEASATATAWGDPPIVVRCGVPEPAALERSSPCTEIDGVGWFAEADEAADPPRHVFTTIGRATFVEVTVPASYEPASAPLVDLAEAVKEAIPEREPCV